MGVVLVWFTEAQSGYQDGDDEEGEILLKTIAAGGIRFEDIRSCSPGRWGGTGEAPRPFPSSRAHHDRTGWGGYCGYVLV